MRFSTLMAALAFVLASACGVPEEDQTVSVQQGLSETNPPTAAEEQSTERPVSSVDPTTARIQYCTSCRPDHYRRCCIYDRCGGRVIGRCWDDTGCRMPQGCIYVP